MKTKLYFLLFIILTSNSKNYAQELFKSEIFGFRVEVPKGWHIITDKKLDYNLKEHHGWHIISFSKYDVENYKGINPIISINVGNNYMSFESWEKVFLKEKNWRNKDLKNVSALEKARVVNIDDKKAFYIFEKYTLFDKKNQLPLRRKSYLVPHKDYLYYIDFTDGQQSEDEQKLFNEIASSIKIN